MYFQSLLVGCYCPCLGKKDVIYYDGNEYVKDHVTHNSTRCNPAFHYVTLFLWEGINYHKPLYMCVEDGIFALFPPLDGKIMGFKKK
jgi:hypothetical protein